MGVQIGLGGARFRRPIGGGRRDYSGIVFLNSGERRVFELGVYGVEDSSEDNEYVSEFQGIYFYAPGGDTPFIGYGLGYHACNRARLYLGRDTPCVYDEGDSRGIDNWFREAPDRAFYLERDAEDRDLSRLVITFVPSAE